MKRKVLPPLDYLVAFEAAALLGSFAAASRDLNISETAISRKVRLLELHYDVPLFVRGHRSITLTPQGHRLLAVVETALDTLRDVSQEMFAEHQSNSVTLAATHSVAALWLMPRLRKFNRSNSRIKINLVASDNDAECLADTVDISILRGDGNWPGFKADLLFGETIFPVCSPQYLKRQNGGINLQDLPHTDLIEVSSNHTEWMNWRVWFQSQGMTDAMPQQAVGINTYPLAIQAAVDGMGIALGWGHLVDHLIDTGALVRPIGDTAVRTEFGYYLLRSERSKPFPEEQIVEDWLKDVSAARKRYG